MNDKPDQVERRNDDDQIGVITLMRLMWKWKLLIVSGIVVCAVTAWIISLLMPHVYEVDMLVENVQIGRDDTGEIVYLGDLKEISQRISAGMYNQNVLDQLGKESGSVFPEKISFDVVLRNNNQLAGISCEAEDVDMGKRILAGLFDQLKTSALERIEYWKKEIDSQIEKKRQEIADIRAGISEKKEEIVLAGKKARLNSQDMLDKAMVERRRIEDKVKFLNEKMAEIKSSIDFLKKEINLLIKIRNDFLGKGAGSRHLGALADLSSIVIEAYNQSTDLKAKCLQNEENLIILKMDKALLDKRIQELKDKLSVEGSFEALNEYSKDIIEKQKERISLKKDEMANLEAEKKSVKNMVLRQAPTGSATALRPDTKRNVIIGAVVGLFLSLFLSVFLEYVYKKTEDLGN